MKKPQKLAQLLCALIIGLCITSISTAAWDPNSTRSNSTNPGLAGPTEEIIGQTDEMFKGVRGELYFGLRTALFDVAQNSPSGAVCACVNSCVIVRDLSPQEVKSVNELPLKEQSCSKVCKCSAE